MRNTHITLNINIYRLCGGYTGWTLDVGEELEEGRVELRFGLFPEPEGGGAVVEASGLLRGGPVGGGCSSIDKW